MGGPLWPIVWLLHTLLQPFCFSRPPDSHSLDSFVVILFMDINIFLLGLASSAHLLVGHKIEKPETVKLHMTHCVS